MLRMYERVAPWLERTALAWLNHEESLAGRTTDEIVEILRAVPRIEPASLTVGRV